MRTLITITVMIATSFPTFCQTSNQAKQKARTSQNGPSGTPEAAVAYPYHLVNLMPMFWQFWTRAQGKDKPTRLTMFRQMVVEPHKEIYALTRSGMDDRSLTQYLDQVQSKAAEMRLISEALPQRLYRRWKTFTLKFPDTRRNACVYIIPAPQNAIGGWVRPFGYFVIFGFDALADTHSENEFSVFVHHELTHLYHAQVNPEFRAMLERYFMKKPGPTPLYQLVWLEGLATYASKALNPQAAPGEVFSQGLAAEIQAKLHELARELRDQMDLSEMSAIADFVFYGNASKGIPRKTAYYIGMLIAEELGRTRSLTQLARLHGKQLHDLVASGLRQLEKGDQLNLRQGAVMGKRRAAISRARPNP